MTPVPTEQSGSPTSSPSGEEKAALVAFIKDMTFAEVSYPSLATAADRALAWIVDEDPMDLLLDNDDPARITQQFALAALWFSSSQSWAESNGWLSSAHECNWFGVSCRQKYVVGIQLAQNNLGGSIPLDIGLLTSMTYFVVNDYAMTGTLPRSIVQLSNVETFYVQANSLVGTLPDSMGLMAKLAYFSIRADSLGTAHRSVLSNEHDTPRRINNMKTFLKDQGKLARVVDIASGGIVV